MSTISEEQARRARQADAAIQMRRTIVEKFQDWKRQPASDNPAAERRLREEAEAASKRIRDMP